MIYWFIGQSGAGKTTLAKRLKQGFDKDGITSIHLDGDDLRKIFGNAYEKENFTKEYRVKWTKILQRFVAHIADQGVRVIVSTVNPYKDVRDEFKKSREDIKEIYVFTDDVRGREHFHAKDFEPPDIDYVGVKTGDKKSIEDTYTYLLSYIL